MRPYVFLLAALAALTPPSAPAAAQSAQGTGQRASDPFPLPAGLAVFEVRHQGGGPFAVRLLDDQGNLVERLAEGTGPFDGSRAVRVPRAGRYLYDVSATGAWSVRLRDGAAGATPATGAPSAPGEMSALHAGQIAARGRGTMGWLGTGLVAGALAGPVGAGINLALASRRSSEVPADVLRTVEGRGRGYVEDFSAAFRERVRANRRTAALVGGLTGTALFAFVLVQVADWSSGSGGNSGGGGETPP